jgi:low temperature requirement protein LtrA
MTFAARANHLRVRDGHEPSRVTFVELFFDLVFVFAVTQLSHGLLEHLTPLGVLQTAILMLAVWWAWMDNAWITNWLDPERAPVRILLFALMLGGLVVSASIPQAFGARGLAFALAYAAVEITPKFFMLWALKRHDATNYRNFVRIMVWRGAGAALWVAGGFADGPMRLGLWALALAIDTSSPLLGFWLPRLGRSTTADWDIEASHFAERCGLFIIIALGESIVVTGAKFAGIDWTGISIAAFLNAFAASVAMWVIYFNIGKERTEHALAATDDPGRLARSAYTYLHIPIVAGVIVGAVGDDLTLQHPGGATGIATAAVILAGPALYIAGNLAFKRLTAPRLPFSHLIGLALLALLMLAVPYLSPLALSGATTAVLIMVGVWEWVSLSLLAGRPPLGSA